jgi:protein transport protein SEC20
MDLDTSLQKLVNLEIEIQSLIVEISSSLTLSTKEASELSTKALRTLSDLSSRIKDIKHYAKEQPNATLKKEILQKLSKHEKEYMNLKDGLRQANMKYKFNREKQRENERRMLLTSSPSKISSLSETGNIRTKDDSLKVTRNITENLKRIRQMMKTQIEHSSDIINELQGQSRLLHEALGEHEEMSDSLQASKNWITKLFRREITDKLLVGLALLFFSMDYELSS